jgi:hypothetical protein
MLIVVIVAAGLLIPIFLQVEQPPHTGLCIINTTKGMGQGGGGPPFLDKGQFRCETVEDTVEFQAGAGMNISAGSPVAFEVDLTELNIFNFTQFPDLECDTTDFLQWNGTQFECVSPLELDLNVTIPESPTDVYFTAEEATVDDLTGLDCVNDVTYSFFDNIPIHQYRRQAIEFCEDSDDDDNITWLHVVPNNFNGTDFKFRLFWTDDNGQGGTVISQVSQDDDDAEESIGPVGPAGHMSLTSTDLELHAENILEADDNDLIGLRFNNIAIPQGATIINASIQFHVDATHPDEPIILRLKGHDIDNAPIFTSTDFDISSRANTTAFVDWNIPDWVNVSDEGPAQRTPDLSAIIQEIVDRGGWLSGNSIVIKSTEWIGCTITSCPVNFGSREAEAFDGEPENAATISIGFTTGQGNDLPVCWELAIMSLENDELMDDDFTGRQTICTNRNGIDQLTITEFTVTGMQHFFEPEDLAFLRLHRPNDFVQDDFESPVFLFGAELQYLD